MSERPLVAKQDATPPFQLAEDGCEFRLMLIEAKRQLSAAQRGPPVCLHRFRTQPAQRRSFGGLAYDDRRAVVCSQRRRKSGRGRSGDLDNDKAGQWTRNIGADSFLRHRMHFLPIA